MDTYHWLYFCLCWLPFGYTFREAEFEAGTSKATINRDLPHILSCINLVLDDQIVWPTIDERLIAANSTNVVFVVSIDVCDVVEAMIGRSFDPANEKATYSGKTGTNTKKTFIDSDWRNLIIYIRSNNDGGVFDREIFTKSSLCQYFDGNQQFDADGVFVDDGPIVCSFNDVDGDPIKGRDNFCFKEKRMQIENTFGRQHNWFPVSGFQYLVIGKNIGIVHHLWWI